MSMSDGQSKLDVMQRKIQRMEQELNKEFKGALEESFKEFFRNHPNVKTLSWTQYTPYFNDGDACYFSYNDLTWYPCTIEVGGQEIECDQPGDDPWWKTKEGQAAMKDVESLNSFMSKFEDALKSLFGDHVEVTASDKGFEVEEHYHD